MWVFNVPLCLNVLPHSVHSKGFCPVCIIACNLSALGVEKALKQMPHILFLIAPPYGTSICTLSFIVTFSKFSVLTICIRSFLFSFSWWPALNMCSSRSICCVNAASHFVHLNNFSASSSSSSFSALTLTSPSPDSTYPAEEELRLLESSPPSPDVPHRSFRLWFSNSSPVSKIS